MRPITNINAGGHRRMSRWLPLAVVLGIFGALLLAAPAADAAPHRTGVGWQPCYERFGNYECARVRVPLDYDDRRSPTIGISVVRRPANDPALREGAIFLNPGGPGGSGVDLIVEGSPFLFNDEIKDRFDLVGFDPRGILRSSPLLCFGSLDEALSVAPPWAFPYGSAEEAVQSGLDLALDAACRSAGQPIADHMATGNVARDIAAIADAMGEDDINYLGASYGSFLGTTLVNLFPDRVRAVVVDGILDPVAWTTGRPGEEDLPFSTRLRSDRSAMATLDEFFRMCEEAGADGCALAGDSAARFAAMAEFLKIHPTVVVDPRTGEPVRVTYAALIGETLGAMYDSFSWSSLAALLAYVEGNLGLAPAPTAAVTAEAAGFDRDTSYVPRRAKYPNFVEGFSAVACSDSDNPGGHGYWIGAAAASEDEYGWFGRPWTWASSPCAVWSATDADRFTGPFDAATEHPVLIVGTRYDPATPYEGAEVLDSLLPNSSLLTVEGWGHTSLFLSACADAIVFNYLLTAEAPPGGAVCAQDFDPFDVPPEPLVAASEERQEARRELLRYVSFMPPSISR